MFHFWASPLRYPSEHFVPVQDNSIELVDSHLKVALDKFNIECLECGLFLLLVINIIYQFFSYLLSVCNLKIDFQIICQLIMMQSTVYS